MHTAIKVKLTKAKIRSKILRELKLQKEEDRERKSRAIKQKLFGLKAFKKAKTVMFYVSCAGEAKTQEMIKAAQKLGKIVAVPISLKSRKLLPALFRSESRLVEGPYGVMEPALKKFVPPEDLDLIVVPGVAFDKKGNRLGRGKGYYDIFLSQLPQDTPTVGVAFDFQILPKIPSTATDVAVKRVLFA